jgi:hypothetical protein
LGDLIDTATSQYPAENDRTLAAARPAWLVSVERPLFFLLTPKTWLGEGKKKWLFADYRGNAICHSEGKGRGICDFRGATTTFLDSLEMTLFRDASSHHGNPRSSKKLTPPSPWCCP